MADTFFSWFLITELHIWMLMVRFMAEGKYGKIARNALVEALWDDVEVRSKKLGVSVYAHILLIIYIFQNNKFLL